MDETAIMQRIKNIIVLTLLALWPKVPTQTSGFELLGFDIMVDSVSPRHARTLDAACRCDEGATSACRCDEGVTSACRCDHGVTTT